MASCTFQFLSVDFFNMKLSLSSKEVLRPTKRIYFTFSKFWRIMKYWIVWSLYCQINDIFHIYIRNIHIFQDNEILNFMISLLYLLLSRRLNWKGSQTYPYLCIYWAWKKLQILVCLPHQKKGLHGTVNNYYHYYHNTISKSKSRNAE